MSQEPKKRHSRARKGKRRAAIKLDAVSAVICKNCGAPHVSHTVCAKCGFYKGQQVIEPKSSKASQRTA
jgi:large subunit ribosomal protein L32